MKQEATSATGCRTLYKGVAPMKRIISVTTMALVMVVYPNVGDLVTAKFSNPAQLEAGQKYALIYSLESPNR